MWEISKRKYENIPFIKNLLATKNQSFTLQENINVLNEEVQNLLIAINKKRNWLVNLDRELIIKVADYLINERPKNIALLKGKCNEIVEINKDIQAIIKNNNNTLIPTKKHVERTVTEVPKRDSLDNSWTLFNKNDELTVS